MNWKHLLQHTYIEGSCVRVHICTTNIEQKNTLYYIKKEKEERVYSIVI